MHAFAINDLGYDPESDDRRPREYFEWVEAKMQAEERRMRWMGAGLSAALAAIITSVVSSIWPLIAHWFHAGGGAP